MSQQELLPYVQDLVSESKDLELQLQLVTGKLSVEVLCPPF